MNKHLWVAAILALLFSTVAVAQQPTGLTGTMLAQYEQAQRVYRVEADQAVEALLERIDLTVAEEPPRVHKDDRGHIRYFGAPPNAPARIDSALRNAAPADQAAAFIFDHAAA